MPIKPTIFFVVDIETTLRKRIAFDIAWQAIDRRGKVYSSGSFVVTDSFKMDVPYYKEKLGYYFSDTYAHLIQPACIYDIRAEFNKQIGAVINDGHRVIACAYNAAFDFKYLPETIRTISGMDNERWMQHKVELLDIWHYWGNSVPLNYTAEPTESGKYISTSAESAYRFEFGQPEFEERHIAWHDVEIESDLLLKTLRRKKPMPVVNSPKEFKGAIWKQINTRLGINGDKPLIEEEIKEAVLETV